MVERNILLRKDLKEKVDYYMEHPKEAEKLAERGHQLVLEKHTFAKRMDKLVQDLSGPVSYTHLTLPTNSRV